MSMSMLAVLVRDVKHERKMRMSWSKCRVLPPVSTAHLLQGPSQTTTTAPTTAATMAPTTADATLT